MKQPPPLRLSEWKAPEPEGGPRPSPTLPRPPESGAPPAIPIAEMARTRPGSSPSAEPPPADVQPAPMPGGGAPKFKPEPTIFQGFDLMRLPGGILRRWWLPLPVACLGAALGLLAGLQLFEVQSTVSVRLMSRNPQSFAISSASYVPSRLQGATLLGALASPQVAREVADKFGEGWNAKQLQSMVSIEEVRKTDFVDVVVTTPFDAKRTVRFAELWAREALAFTSRLQADESAEMKRYLEEQLTRTDKELAEVNAKIIAMREESGVIDVDKEIDSYLKSLSEMDLKYQTARIDLDGVHFQLESLRKEIRKHSPSFEELKAEEVKLQEMAEYYTERNPVYLEAEDRVRALREKVRVEVDSPDVPLSDFTGTYVGNALYLQILDLESREENLELQIQQYEAMRTEAREKLKDLPDKAMIAGPLLENSQALRAARDILIKRLQEVQVFQEVAPGYYRLFKMPQPKDVILSSRRNKLIMVTVLGGLFFALLGMLAAAAMEFLDPTVRTAAEAECALECPALARIPSVRSVGGEPPRPNELWASVIGGLSSFRARVFWTPVSAPEETVFWGGLIEAGQSMGLSVLVVHAGGDLPAPFDALPRISPAGVSEPLPSPGCFLLELPVDTDAAGVREMIVRLKAARGTFQEVWIRCGGMIREPAASFAREFSGAALLCALGVSDRDFWRSQRTLLGSPARPLRGVVTLG